MELNGHANKACPFNNISSLYSINTGIVDTATNNRQGVKQ